VDIPDHQTESDHADQNEDECDEEFGRGRNDGEGLGGEDPREEIDAAHFLCLWVKKRGGKALQSVEL